MPRVAERIRAERRLERLLPWVGRWDPGGGVRAELLEPADERVPRFLELVLGAVVEIQRELQPATGDPYSHPDIDLVLVSLGVLEGTVPSQPHHAGLSRGVRERLVLAQNRDGGLVRLHQHKPEVLGRRVIRRERGAGGPVHDARDRPVIRRNLHQDAAVLHNERCGVACSCH